MASSTLPNELKGFASFIKMNASLAPYTQLKIGGPAELLVQPNALDELIAFIKVCFAKSLRFRILGSGGNILVHDDGVKGIVLRLAGPAFTNIALEGRRLKAGGGATLFAVIATAARAGLT